MNPIQQLVWARLIVNPDQLCTQIDYGIYCTIVFFPNPTLARDVLRKAALSYITCGEKLFQR